MGGALSAMALRHCKVRADITARDFDGELLPPEQAVGEPSAEETQDGVPIEMLPAFEHVKRPERGKVSLLFDV